MICLINNWHNRKTIQCEITVLTHSLQEGHMYLDVVNIIMSLSHSSHKKIKSWGWSLWVGPRELLELCFISCSIWRSLRLHHLWGKLFKYRPAGRVLDILSHSPEERESQDGDGRLNLVLSFLDSWAPGDDRIIWLQRPWWHHHSIDSYWWCSAPLLPLPLCLSQRWLVFQGWSPLKPILKESGSKLIWGLWKVGIYYEKVTDPQEVAETVQRSLVYPSPSFHSISILCNYIVQYQNKQLTLLQVCDSIASCEALCHIQWRPATPKITLSLPLILTHPVLLLYHIYTKYKALMELRRKKSVHSTLSTDLEIAQC